MHAKIVMLFTIMCVWAPFLVADNLLRIGMSSDIKADGQKYYDFDCAVAAKVAQCLNKELCITNFYGLPACFQALERGEINAIMSFFPITLDYLEQWGMVKYYQADLKINELVYVGDILDGVKDLHDLGDRDLEVGVRAGSLQERFIRQCYPKVKLRVEPGYPEMFQGMESGAIKCLLVGPFAAKVALEKMPALGKLAVTLPDTFEIQGAGIVHLKNNTILQKSLVCAMLKLCVEAVLEELELQYLSQK